MSNPGAGIGREIASGERTDAELDAFISRRASQDRGPAPDELEPGYAESVRRHNAKIRRENRAAWCEYHRGQADRLRRNLEDLISRHEALARKLLEGEA